MHNLNDGEIIEIKNFIKEHYDNCSICNRAYIENEDIFLGYNYFNQLICIGKCCTDQLKDVIGNVHYIKRPYTIPENSSILWRYMDYDKFISLICNRALYFSRPDKFLDPFEGAKGLLRYKDVWYRASLENYKNILRTFPNGLNKSDDRINSEAVKLLSAECRMFRKDVKSIYINCWHENLYESEAMWKLYTKNLKKAIAIKTTFYGLCTALKKESNIQIGRVNYLDYSTRILGLNESFWFKRKSFEFEKEVRVFQPHFSNDGVFGRLVNVDIEKLIDNIYISPLADKRFYSQVVKQLEKYEINKGVNFSSLIEKPFF